MTTSTTHVGVVLPGDNRQRVLDSTQAPYRWVGRLYSTWPNQSITVGTAVLIDDIHLLTCAHNLLDRVDHVTARQVTFTPAHNRSGNASVATPYPTMKVVRFQAPQQYMAVGGPPPPPGGIQRHEISHYLFDFAVCRLDSQVVDPPGPSQFGLAPVNPATFPIAVGQVAGYSGDLDRTGSTMYSRNGAVNLDGQEGFISYQISTYEGDSGAPVFYQPPNRPYWYVLGVHVTGVAPSGPYANDGLNFGPALNQDNHHLIQQMIEEVDRGRPVRW